MNRQSIAIIHPYLWRGGSEACALWAVEALKTDYDVTLISGGGVDLQEMNRYYGTDIRPGEIKVIAVPFPSIFRIVNGFFALRDYRLARFCRRNAKRFDVMFSTYNPMDFGKKGIQYILDPNFNSELLMQCASDPRGLKGLFYRESPLRRSYIKLAGALSGLTMEGIKKNLTIADSDWTARATREVLGIVPTTVYPPVPWDYPFRAWSEKEDGFVCLGRISSEKRLEDTLGILEHVRKAGWNFHIHIIGTVGDRSYMKSLGPLLKRCRDWAFIEGSVSGQKKMELLTGHRYGLHGRAFEPFGIAVAEMVKAGCIVWVPNGGGQVEIVDHPILIYESVEAAVSKIKDVLTNESLRNALLDHLKIQGLLFTVERYRSDIRKTVEAFLGS